MTEVKLYNPEKYAEIDDKIIVAIKSGEVFFWQINHKVPLGYRLLDRRLQILRRAGKIKFNGPKAGWSIAS